MSKLVFGVGLNDVKMTQLNGRKSGKKAILWVCPLFRTWKHMLERCYSPAYQDLYPTYKGCTVCDDWLTFSNFKAWMATQDWKGKHLDKDILVLGNKVYSPATCCFVERQLNMFFTNDNVGLERTGTRCDAKSGQVMARCSNPFTRRREYLGMFATPEAAHTAWRHRKHELACQYADIQSDPRVADALRTRFAP